MNLLSDRALEQHHATVRDAVAALRETTALMAQALTAFSAAQQLQAEVARAQLDEVKGARERLDALRRQADAPVEDLPEPVQQMVLRFAGENAGIRSQLAAYARKRLSENVAPLAVANEIARGADPKTL